MNKKLTINNKPYISEAFEQLNNMIRMCDSKKFLKESSKIILKESNSNIQNIKTKISDFLFDYFDEHFLSEVTELVEKNFPNYNPEWCSDNDESSTYDILSDLVDDLVESLFYYAND